MSRPTSIDRGNVLSCALALSEEVGYQRVTRQALASRAEISEGQVSLMFGTMPQLRRAIMSAAVAASNLKVIAQGLAIGDSKASAASAKVKRDALDSLL